MPNKRDSCCVPGCENCTSLHKFPHPVKESGRFRRWVIDIGGDILGLDDEYIYRNRRVCHIHFDEYYKCRNNRISNIALPTLNLPGFRNTIPTLRRPLQEMQNIISGDSVPSTSTIKTYETKSLEPVNQEKESHTVKRNEQKTRRLHLTKPQKILFNEIKKLKLKLNKLKSQSKKQSASLKLAKNLITNTNFLNVTENLTAAGKLLTLLQFREYKKKSKGRRFSINEKILALTIFKQSPKAYRFLRQILILPAPQTLLKLLSMAMISPGINEKILEQLRVKAMKMNTTEKLCVLLFDEVSIQPALTYNAKQDQIIGFATDGTKTLCSFANHALVFMIRGLMKNYKQPVAYMFCTGATKATELKIYITKVIEKLQEVGFIVLATVCDQGTNNQKAIKTLIENTKIEYLKKNMELKKNMFIVNGQEILSIFDPPHLLKGIRNNLLVKNLKYEVEKKGYIAKWAHIEMLYNENPAYKGIRLMPKLTENHVVRNKIGKMRVKFASQIFSETVSSNMGYLAEKKIIPEECKETADLLLFFDRLFDSLNSSYSKKNKHGKPYLKAVKSNSIHHKLWQEAKMTLQSMKFINRKGKEERVPTLENWLWTINSVQDLIKKVNYEYNINSLWTRHLNQDPLEKFFGAIRSQGLRNNNPSASAFQSAFTSLIINNLTSIHAVGSNCEDDLCDSLQVYFISQYSKIVNVHELDEAHLTANIITFEEKMDNERIMAPLAYVSGYILRQCKKKIFKNCKICKQVLCDSTNSCAYIKHREYAGRNWLSYPTTELIRIISDIQEIFYNRIKDNFNKPCIKEYIKTVVLVTIDFKCIVCESHKNRLIDFLINITLRFFLYNYCKSVNNILMGKRKMEDSNDFIQNAAQDHFNKNLKKVRK